MVFLKWSVQFWISMHNTSMAPKRSQSINLSFIIATSNGLNIIHWFESSFKYYGLQFRASLWNAKCSVCQLYFTKFANSIHIAISLFCYFAKFTFPLCQCHFAKLSSPHCWSWIFFLFAKLWGWRCQLHFMDEMFNQIS